MAQLSDDCFAFGGKLLTLDAAVALIRAETQPRTGVEHVALAQADGRILATDVVAPMDLPPFRNSAVDGYAVRLADLNTTDILPVVGRLVAGAAATEPLGAGTARRIFTGAAMPPSADTVFMQEDVELVSGGPATQEVRCPTGLKPGANTRPQGEDIAVNTVALLAGLRLRPQDLALAAALGLRELPVRRAVQLALFSTGSELAEPGNPLGPAKLFDANRILLMSLARRAGAAVTDLGILPDQRASIEAALLRASQDHDLLLTSGGVSAGEEDHVRDAVQAVGRLTFWRLAIKPGRPVAMGQVAGVPFMGLPGNSVAAFVTFAQVARPLIAALGGAAAAPSLGFPAVAAFSYRKKAGRREYVRVRAVAGPDGTPHLHKHPIDGAGILTSLTRTDGLAELAEDVLSVVPGTSVRYLPYEGGLL